MSGSGGSWPSDAWRPGPPASPAPGPPPSGWAPPAGAAPGPPGAPGPYGYWPAPARTNALAVVALVAGIAQVVVWVVGTITAIVCGHIALGQIRRSQGAEQGAGMARAGLVLGYVGLGLTVLGIAGVIVFLVGFADDVQRAQLRDQARDWVGLAETRALLEGTDELRDPDILTSAYFAQLEEDAHDGEMYLATGVSLPSATRDDWEEAAWRVELRGDDLREAFVCTTVPVRRGNVVVVTNGRCR
jgi:hypothetical protein